MKEQIGKIPRLTPSFGIESNANPEHEIIAANTVKMIELSPENMAALILKLRATNKRMIPGVYNPETESITLLN